MDPRQVIGLAVVLHRQLPVAADLDGDGGVGAAVTQPREVEVGPALGDGRDEVRESRRLAGEVDEDGVCPDGGTPRPQAVPGLAYDLPIAGSRPAVDGPRPHAPVQEIVPGVIGAAEEYWPRV